VHQGNFLGPKGISFTFMLQGYFGHFLGFRDISANLGSNSISVIF